MTPWLSPMQAAVPLLLALLWATELPSQRQDTTGIPRPGAGTQVGFEAALYHCGSWLWLPLSLPSSAPIKHFHAPAERYDISAWRMLGHPREPVLPWQGCETKETSASETLLYSLLLKKQNLYVQ